MAHFIMLDALPSLTFLGTITDSGIPSSPWTISGVNFGTPRSDRVIILGVGTATDTVTSVTIGGVSASLAAGSRLSGASPFPLTMGIYSAAVPSGTSGNIVMTASGSSPTFGNPAFSVYAAYGLLSATSVDGDASLGSGGTNSGSVNVPVNGFAIACALETLNSNVPSFTWSGVARDDQIHYANSNYTCGSMGPANSAFSPLSISVTPSDGSRPFLSMASYR